MKNKKDKVKVGRPKLAEEQTKKLALLYIFVSFFIVLVLGVTGYFVLFNSNVEKIKASATVNNSSKVSWGTIKSIKIKDISSNENNQREIKINLSNKNLGESVKIVKMVVCRTVSECKKENLEIESESWGKPVFVFNISNKSSMTISKKFYDVKNKLLDDYYMLITTASGTDNDDILKTSLVKLSLDKQSKDSKGYYSLKREIKLVYKKYILKKGSKKEIISGTLEKAPSTDVVTYDDGVLKANAVGKTTMKLKKDKTEYRYTIIVVPNKEMLKFTKKSAKKVIDVDALSHITGKNTTIQNFDVGSKYYYFSYSALGNYKCTNSNASIYEKNNFVSTNVIMRCEKDNCNKTKKYLVFNNAGHGQQFDMFSVSGNTYVVMNSRGYQKVFGSYDSNICSNKNQITYNSGSKDFYVLNLSEKNSNGSLKYQFKSLNEAKNSAVDLKNKSTFTNLNGRVNADISIDSTEELMATRLGSYIYIYKMKKNNKNVEIPYKCEEKNQNGTCKNEKYILDNDYLISKFKIEKQDYSSFQDILIHGGYVYVLCSGSHTSDGKNSKAYIYTYDVFGNEQDNTKTISQNFNGKETEALAYKEDEGLFFITAYKKNSNSKYKTNGVYKVDLK